MSFHQFRTFVKKIVKAEVCDRGDDIVVTHTSNGETGWQWTVMPHFNQALFCCVSSFCFSLLLHGPEGGRKIFQILFLPFSCTPTGEKCEPDLQDWCQFAATNVNPHLGDQVGGMSPRLSWTSWPSPSQNTAQLPVFWNQLNIPSNSPLSASAYCCFPAVGCFVKKNCFNPLSLRHWTTGCQSLGISVVARVAANEVRAISNRTHKTWANDLTSHPLAILLLLHLSVFLWGRRSHLACCWSAGTSLVGM